MSDDGLKVRQVLIVGLGRFGMTLARSLTEKGVEVLGVDGRDDRVREAARFVAEALCFDAADEEALTRVAPDKRDVCICAIGDESREASILCTALLRQLGARRLVARANNPLHARILRFVGAHEVVNPIANFAERFADRVCHQELLGELPLGEGLSVVEFRPPKTLVGYTLAELDLRRRFGINVVALRDHERGEVKKLTPDLRIESDDILVVVAEPHAVERLLRENHA